MDIDEQITTEHLLLKERVCRSCGKEKSLLADFHRCGKDATLASSYSYECKECSRKRAVDNYWKKKKYSLVRKKDKVCVICGTTKPGGRFNKFTMRDEDLLCSNCDKIMKLAGDNIHTLESMVQYLHKTNAKSI